MLPWQRLERTQTPDGSELLLCRRGHDYVIRVDGLELMSSHAHGSETAMAQLAAGTLPRRPEARWLVGGLGMGFTVRACLDLLGPADVLEVVELVPAVIEWNRGPLAHLAANPLSDPRVRVQVADVADVLRGRTAAFDAILLDVDNGPVALSQKANAWIYGPAGLSAARATLRRPGVLVVWSADDDPAFTRRLQQAGFAPLPHRVPARGEHGGPVHTVWTATALPSTMAPY